LISGGTGTGKTTLLAALLAKINQNERIVVIEDLHELVIEHPHVVSLQARGANTEGFGEVPLRTLTRQALRMRPDRLILGEVRGAEIVDLFAALNTGHSGGCATVHANSAKDVPARVVGLGLLAGLPSAAIHNLFATAISVVIEISKTAGGIRRVTGLHQVQLVSGEVQTIPILDEENIRSISDARSKFMSVMGKGN
jgi:pilus assembly protein CpaF